MKTLYNIYEASKSLKNVYHGILGDIEDTLTNSDKDIKKIYNSPKEKFIRIVCNAGHFNNNETLLFRKITTEAIATQHAQAYLCYFPNELRDMLIVASKRSLKASDFKGFPTNKNKHDLNCSIEYMHLVGLSPKVETIKDVTKNDVNKIIKLTNGVSVVKIKDTYVAFDGYVIYVWVNGIYRVVFTLEDNANYPNKDILPL